ncbi:polymorphic toxin-type HINT domain-containing protein [Tessaracoccus caeni]|uniref:polymorphic toxin-type HINT domain-containing protein n=1 Tax=Tessaracoccus caeni TaxID=3031239 RepID=UPI0023DB431D|nr:polymorphic toxin-type HINT domain-containing protein [Tessaracoccus caeni]MDF1488274.1 polymorphic toxin-type HINT domain-containing protein [Tessaracoccus caeni]
MCPSGGGRKPIDEVQVGDLVVATDPETGEHAAKVVEAVFVHEDEVYGLSIDGETIATTEDHPFWSVTDQQFEQADQLAAAEQVLAVDGTPLVVTRPVFRTATTRALAYNLTVGETHTYHVGETQTLVHNDCGPDLDALAASGGEPVKKTLTRAGHSYQKHRDRGQLAPVENRELNSAGLSLLEDILTAPGTRVVTNRGGNFAGRYLYSKRWHRCHC